MKRLLAAAAALMLLTGCSSSSAPEATPTPTSTWTYTPQEFDEPVLDEATVCAAYTDPGEFGARILALYKGWGNGQHDEAEMQALYDELWTYEMKSGAKLQQWLSTFHAPLLEAYISREGSLISGVPDAEFMKSENIDPYCNLLF